MTNVLWNKSSLKKKKERKTTLPRGFVLKGCRKMVQKLERKARSKKGGCAFPNTRVCSLAERKGLELDGVMKIQ